MSTNIGLRKAGTFWFALVSVLGLGLIPLAIPATAQVRSGAQPMPNIARPPVFNRDTNLPTSGFPHRTQVLNAQPCGTNAYMNGYDPFSAPSFGTQSCAPLCASSETQSTLDDLNVTSWYGFNRNESAWWASPNFNGNLGFGPCSNFQGWWTP